VNANVRFGSKADICTAPADVRFTPNSRHEKAVRDLRSQSVALEPKMSALTLKADMCSALADVCSGPIADIVGNQRQRSLGIVKDNAKRMTHSAPNAANTMPKIYPIIPFRSFDRPVVHSKRYRITLS
jgi:hypothetical protein